MNGVDDELASIRASFPVDEKAVRESRREAAAQLCAFIRACPNPADIAAKLTASIPEAVIFPWDLMFGQHFINAEAYHFAIERAIYRFVEMCHSEKRFERSYCAPTVAHAYLAMDDCLETQNNFIMATRILPQSPFRGRSNDSPKRVQDHMMFLGYPGLTADEYVNISLRNQDKASPSDVSSIKKRIQREMAKWEEMQRWVGGEIRSQNLK